MKQEKQKPSKPPSQVGPAKRGKSAAKKGGLKKDADGLKIKNKESDN